MTKTEENERKILSVLDSSLGTSVEDIAAYSLLSVGTVRRYLKRMEQECKVRSRSAFILRHAFYG